MRHDTRRFGPQVDFVTTPGYFTGPGAREEAGLPPGTGPIHVVSTLGLMGFDAVAKRMTLLATHPGVTAEELIASIGFELLREEPVGRNDPLTPEELRILRKAVDRDRLYT
jgi:glutaconate CoA-transferase subunit B